MEGTMESLTIENIPLVLSIGIGVIMLFLLLFIFILLRIIDIAKNNSSNKSMLAKQQKIISNLQAQVAEISSRKPSKLEFQALIEDLSSAGAPDGIIKALEDVLFVVEDIESTVNVQVQVNESLAQRISSIEKRITAVLAKTLCRAKRHVRDEIDKRMERVFIKLRGMEDVNADKTEKQFGILKRLEHEEIHSLEERVSRLEAISEVLQIMDQAEQGESGNP